jgi:hypothetical protein
MKSGWKFGVGTSVALSGVTGTVITGVAATGTVLWGPEVIALFGGCIATGVVVAWLRGKRTLLPDSLVDEMNADGKYSCRFCGPDNLRDACDMTRPYYGHEYVESDVALGWLTRNPGAFVEIVNAENVLAACFGILPLESSFMDQFIKGRLDDHQIQANDICSYEDGLKCARLYISGVIVRDHTKHLGRKRASVMIWVMLWYIRSVYGLRKKRTLYAVSVTKESETLMKNLGFTLATEAKDRKDSCNLFSYDLTPASWKAMLAKVGDWSGACVCEFKKAGAPNA